MKRLCLSILAVAALAVLIHLSEGDSTVMAAKPVNISCASCHPDFSKVLPKGHPGVKGRDVTACTPCHEHDPAGRPQKNAYSSRMHLAHVPPKGSLDCEACHSWNPGKSFGLIGVKGSWGAPSKDGIDLMKKIFASWASSQFTDNLHAKGGVTCAGCHGKDLPKSDETVENTRCLECHGPADKLAKKTEPRDFPDRNPHKSHLRDINCTVCHKEHSESKVYCLECHKKFQMNIKGDSKK